MKYSALMFDTVVNIYEKLSTITFEENYFPTKDEMKEKQNDINTHTKTISNINSFLSNFVQNNHDNYLKPENKYLLNILIPDIFRIIKIKSEELRYHNFNNYCDNFYYL